MRKTKKRHVQWKLKYGQALGIFICTKFALLVKTILSLPNKSQAYRYIHAYFTNTNVKQAVVKAGRNVIPLELKDPLRLMKDKNTLRYLYVPSKRLH